MTQLVSVVWQADHSLVAIQSATTRMESSVEE